MYQKNSTTYLIRDKVKKKVKVSPLQSMKAHEDVDARVHICAVTALGRGKQACPTLTVFTPGKAPVVILHEAEWTPGPVWTRRSEEKSPHLRRPESYQDRPARTKGFCHFYYLTHGQITRAMNKFKMNYKSHQL